MRDLCWHFLLATAWWRHQMETFSDLVVFCAGNASMTDEFPHKGQWRGAFMFSVICAWTNSWANSGDAGDFSCHCAHYVVTVMSCHNHHALSFPVAPYTLSINSTLRTHALASIMFIIASKVFRNRTFVFRNITQGSENNHTEHFRCLGRMRQRQQCSDTDTSVQK